MINDLDRDLNDEDVRTLLGKFKDLKLADHYDFDNCVTTPLKNADLISEFIKSNKPLIFEISDSNTLYYKFSDCVDANVFTVDVETSFSKSDLWLYEKLIPVNKVFPTIMEGRISNEMTSFYTCLVIASVFGGAFEEEFLEVTGLYNFTVWKAKDGECISMTDLATSWIQLGSKYIKLVASAAKYALVRESQKKHVPSALQLPQDVVLELNKTIRDVATIRYEYDDVKLSAVNRERMNKLDVKVLIAERDIKIHKRITENSKIYQVWRLMNLNSNVIPPTILLRINREAKKSSLALFQSIRACDGTPVSNDEKLSCKFLENKCKKVVRRAYLNKLFAIESVKFSQDPDNYIAPNFV